MSQELNFDAPDQDYMGFTKEEFQTMREAVLNGATLSDVLNIKPEALEAGYTLGYNLYSAGNYADAETMFRALCLYNRYDVRFWMGLAGCLQARGAYQHAIDTYSMAAMSDGLKDPTPIFHGGLCYLKLNDVESASGAFKAALTMGDPANPAHKACHEKINALMEAILENIEEKVAS